MIPLRSLLYLLSAIACFPAFPACAQASCPDDAALARYVSCDSVASRLATRPLGPVEGIWRFPATGAVVAIEQDPRSPVGAVADRYTVTVIESPRRSVLPGTVMGHVVPTAESGVYHASLFTDSDGGSRLFRTRRFSLRLTDDSRLIFKPLGWNVKTRIWQAIPYLSRLVWSVTREQDEAHDGCVRIYPRSAGAPSIPVYL